MKIFTDEFKGFIKRTFLCTFFGHKKGTWAEVFWAPAHSAGYKSRFCQICYMELETTRQNQFSSTSKSPKKR